MKKIAAILFATVMLTAAVAQNNLEIDVTGARKGVWSMDFNAVTKAAEKDQAHIFVLFTGSDWCKWCKLMYDRVFIQKEWQDFSSQLYLAYIDFPKDQSKLPDNVRDQNQELQDRFNVDGYPTMILLAPDGTPQAQFIAYPAVTADSFIRKIRAKLLFTQHEREKIFAVMPEEILADVKTNAALADSLRTQLKDAALNREKEIEAINAKYEQISQELNQKLSGCEKTYQSKMKEFLLNRKSPETAKRFNEIQTQLTSLSDDFAKWKESIPEDSEPNRKRYETYDSQIKTLNAQLSEILESVLP